MNIPPDPTGLTALFEKVLARLTTVETRHQEHERRLDLAESVNQDQETRLQAVEKGVAERAAIYARLNRMFTREDAATKRHDASMTAMQRRVDTILKMLISIAAGGAVTVITLITNQVLQDRHGITQAIIIAIVLLAGVAILVCAWLILGVVLARRPPPTPPSAPPAAAP